MRPSGVRKVRTASANAVKDALDVFRFDMVIVQTQEVTALIVLGAAVGRPKMRSADPADGSLVFDYRDLVQDRFDEARKITLPLLGDVGRVPLTDRCA